MLVLAHLRSLFPTRGLLKVATSPKAQSLGCCPGDNRPALRAAIPRVCVCRAGTEQAAYTGTFRRNPSVTKIVTKTGKKIKHMNKETLERIFNNHSYEAKRESWC